MLHCCCAKCKIPSAIILTLLSDFRVWFSVLVDKQHYVAANNSSYFRSLIPALRSSGRNIFRPFDPIEFCQFVGIFSSMRADEATLSLHRVQARIKANLYRSLLTDDEIKSKKYSQYLFL